MRIHYIAAMFMRKIMVSIPLFVSFVFYIYILVWMSNTGTGKLSALGAVMAFLGSIVVLTIAKVVPKLILSAGERHGVTIRY
jgi:hypothetical protein